MPHILNVFKRLTLDEIWPEHKFISGDNHHLTSWFCRGRVRSNSNSNTYQSPYTKLTSATADDKKTINWITLITIYEYLLYLA